MTILAIDSSGMTAAVALLEDGKLVAEYNVNYKKTHSQTLLPMMDEIRRITELDLRSIDCIAVAAGPGSFTGLRIGSATAKGLGLALKKPLVEVPTLEGLAFNVPETDAFVCPMMDARRNQVYTGIYRFEDDRDTTWGRRLCVIHSQCAVEVAQILEEVNELGGPVIFLGDGADAYKEEICAKTKVPVRFATAGANAQRGSSVAARALDLIREGKTVSSQDHRPDYLRVSQAERERAVREAKKRENSGNMREQG